MSLRSAILSYAITKAEQNLSFNPQAFQDALVLLKRLTPKVVLGYLHLC